VQWQAVDHFHKLTNRCHPLSRAELSKVAFGTYPSNIGHVDSSGCFRCHDDNHKSKDGTTIKQDCETCHTIEQ
jgi:hypothetical protein